MNKLSYLLITLSFYYFIGISCKKDTGGSELKQPYSETAPPGYTVYESEKQKFWLDTVAKGVEFPWAMAFLPNGDILFTERSGKLKRIRSLDGNIDEISGLPQLAVVGQGGLLDLILHPDYSNQPWLYFSYAKTVGSNYTTAVARAKLSGNSLIDLQVLFEAQPAFSTMHHFGCRLVIHKGYLYFGVGDRGQTDQAQLLDRHNGKIMRLHDDGKVPTDNPFVSLNNAKPEIWTYGHRNPQGLALNSTTGTLWEHEHGPKGGDELNIIIKGHNYGWAEITYGIDYDGSVISPYTHKDGMDQPVKYWVPSIAPCGMIFYHGKKYPYWKENIFLGGLVSQTLFRLEMQGSEFLKQEELLKNIGRVRNVAVSPDGFIYFSTENPGYIFRIVPVNR